MADGDPNPSWRPSVEDVAAIIPARTKVRGGTQVDTFQDANPSADPPLAPTNPTATRVERLIDNACRRVSSRIGGPTICQNDKGLEDDAKEAAAIYTAMLIEQGYML